MRWEASDLLEWAGATGGRTTIFLNFFLRGKDLGETQMSYVTEKKVQENGNGNTSVSRNCSIILAPLSSSPALALRDLSHLQALDSVRREAAGK